MVMTVAELRQFVDTTETDSALGARLQALELLIRAYTNNNFQNRALRTSAVANANKTLVCDSASLFSAGDTIQITNSTYQQDQLCTISSIASNTITVAESLITESDVLITKVIYPADIKLGVANMVKWALDNGDKVGVQSESISRHSVTYFNMDGDNSLMGYPKSLLGFLKPYIKARFGQGIRA